MSIEKKHSILIISYISPYPVTDGGRVSIYGTVNYLRKYFDITLVFGVYSQAEATGTEELKKIWPDVDIRPFIDYRQPGLMKKIKTPLKKIYGPVKTGIKNIIRKQKPVSRSSFRLQPIEIIYKPFVSFIQDILSKKRFDIIQVEYIGLISLINILPEEPKKIFVQIENRFLLLRDMLTTEHEEEFYKNYLVNNARNQEASFMRMYDHVFALNRNDGQIMEKEMNLDNVFVTPYPILDSMMKTQQGEMFKASKILFIGSQAHYPNEDAVKWFVDTMYKEIKRQTGLKLYVTGNWSKEVINKYPGVEFTGFVDDLSDLMNNSIVISPIRIGGGGVRAKVIMAMAMRSPVISTTLCAEGLEELEDGKNILLADTESSIINSIKKLVDNPVLGQNIIENASALIERHYSEKAVGERRRKFYNSILEKN